MWRLLLEQLLAFRGVTDEVLLLAVIVLLLDLLQLLQVLLHLLLDFRVVLVVDGDLAGV